MSRYFDELKRRNVFRVAAAYAVVGWLIIEVIDTIAPRLGMPEWVPGFVILLVLIGFPIALLFSWAFEMTPEGLKKTAEVDADESITSTTGQKINYIIITALAAVVLFQQFSPSLSKLSPFSENTDSNEAIAIAILPFADLSPAGDQEYLGDGVAEEVLNVLAGIDGLKVTSRTSAFAFKNENRPIPEIANILGVSHVVEGSIRKQDNRVRITAQLIDVASDAHLWSQTYDSNLNDIFRLQDEIAGQISAALSSSLQLSLPAVERETPDWDVAAYELYLRARQLVVAREDYDEANELLNEALKLEPRFADAWAEKATALSLRAFRVGLDGEKTAESFATYELAWSAARRATDIDSEHPLGLAVKGLIRMNQKRWVEARVYFERAVHVSKPNDNAYLWLGILQSMTGDIDGSLATFDTGLEKSPTAPNLQRWRARILVHKGHFQEVWDARVDPAALQMRDTLDSQKIAALRLGEITIDEAAEWLGSGISSMPETRADFVAFVRTHAAGETSTVATAEVTKFLEYDVAGRLLMDVWPAVIDQYFEMKWREILARPNGNELDYLWHKDAAAFRGSPVFYELVRELNLPAYWELYGWPDVCRAKSDDDFVCN